MLNQGKADGGRPPGESVHVVHVVLSLDLGGLERNVLNQVRQGPNLGQRVSIVCLERAGMLAPQAEACGAVVVELGKPPGLAPRMVMSVWHVLRQLRPHVVHTHQLATLLYGGAAARLAGTPVVVHTEHGRERYAERRQTRLLGRIAGSFCDRFYCLTDDMAGEIVARRIIPRHKVRVIENGIDVQSFTQSFDSDSVRRSFSVPPDAPLIGTVGRLTEVKQQHVLIRAFASVRARAHNAHLLLVGDGPLREPLARLACDMGLEDCVHFAGYQPHSGPYLQAMDVFALTSRSEGMPQSLLEAAVTGLPIAASRVGGIPEVVRNGVTGLLFEAGDETALAAALCDLITDRHRSRALGGAARASVESRFSVARMAREYHRDFLRLLRGRAPVEPPVPAGRCTTGASLRLGEAPQ